MMTPPFIANIPVVPPAAQPLLMEINQKEQESQNTADAQMRGTLSWIYCALLMVFLF